MYPIGSFRTDKPGTMSVPPKKDITQLLKAWGDGDSAALDQMLPEVHGELLKLAKRYMRRERAGHTLQSGALVNEVFLRMTKVTDVSWQDRAHFFALASEMMRRILVDSARTHAATKRGGDLKKVSFDAILDFAPGRERELIAIDEALKSLAKLDPRKSRVIELRFFGGLSVEETAHVLNLSPQSVMRDWKLAKAWLMREMRTPTVSPPPNG